MFDSAQFLTQKLSFDVGNLTVSPSYLQAIVIVFFLVVLVFALAQFRRHMVHWSMRGAVFGIFIGFVFALILEGFLIIGGRTALTEILGWEKAPKPLVNVIDMGRNKLVNVLGVQTSTIPTSYANEVTTSTEFLRLYQQLTVMEARKVQSLICEP